MRFSKWTVGALKLAGVVVAGSIAAVAPGLAQIAAPELSKAKIAVTPITSYATIFIAKENGDFKKYGLDVEPVIVESGPAATAQLAGGSAEFAAAGYFAFIFGNVNGIPLRVVAEASRESPGSNTVQVLDDSPIREPKDLLGKRLAVNAVKGPGDIGINAVMAALGLDYKKIEYVEMPFGNMGAALQQKQVDAIWTAEPIRTTVKKAIKTRDVLDYNSGPLDRMPGGGFIASDAFAKKNPKTVAAFQCGIAAAARRAKDINVVRGILPKYTTLKPELISEINLPTFPEKVDVAQVQRNADILIAQNLVKAGFKVADYTVMPPANCD